MIQPLVYVIKAQSILFFNGYNVEQNLYNATANNKDLVKRNAKH